MMSVKYTNSPKGIATKTKTVTDKKTGNVISHQEDTQLVEVPGQSGMAMLGAQATPYGEVGYAAGFTKGMPNYSAARVDISLKMPATPDYIDETFEFAEDWVSKRLQKQYEEL